MSSVSASFRSARYTDGFSGFPSVAVAGQNEALVADGSGHVFWLSLAPYALRKKAFVGLRLGSTPVCVDLHFLTVCPAKPMLCAVATRGGFAALWNRQTDELRKVHSTAGSVHSVAWGGPYLIVGAGAYSADGQQARVEVWDLTEDEPFLIAATALPGTCVDDICLDEENNVICFTGMRSQKQGFLAVLEFGTLRARSFIELPFAMVYRVECTPWGILLAYHGNVRAIDGKNGKEQWAHKAAGDGVDFAYDPDSDRVLLSNGTLVTADKGRVIEQWPVLENCCCVATRPEGGFLGVSKTGNIGIWEVNA